MGLNGRLEYKREEETELPEVVISTKAQGLHQKYKELEFDIKKDLSATKQVVEGWCRALVSWQPG
jgi:hypothetical protein